MSADVFEFKRHQKINHIIFGLFFKKTTQRPIKTVTRRLLDVFTKPYLSTKDKRK